MIQTAIENKGSIDQDIADAIKDAQQANEQVATLKEDMSQMITDYNSNSESLQNSIVELEQKLGKVMSAAKSLVAFMNSDFRADADAAASAASAASDAATDAATKAGTEAATKAATGLVQFVPEFSIRKWLEKTHGWACDKVEDWTGDVCHSRVKHARSQAVAMVETLENQAAELQESLDEEVRKLSEAVAAENKAKTEKVKEVVKKDAASQSLIEFTRTFNALKEKQDAAEEALEEEMDLLAEMIDKFKERFSPQLFDALLNHAAAEDQASVDPLA